jgi:DNA-binding GntR family transcriptional regulator
MDPKAYLKTNWTFHEFIQKLSKNKVLNEVANGLRQKILLYRQRQLYQPNRFEASIQEHREILAAFRKKDPELSEKAMKKHLLRQGQALVKSYKSEDAN